MPSPIRALAGWRRHARIVAKAARLVIPGAEVYVFGGAAEGRLTARSDIDLLVVLDEKPGFEEACALRARILEEAERLGLPLDAPVEIHFAGKNDLPRYARRSRLLPLG